MTAPTASAEATFSDAALRKLLERLPGELSRTTIRTNLALVSELAQPQRFAEFLDGLLTDDARLAAIASRSYRHANHFDKIVLADLGDPQGYRVTLHLWNPPYTDAEAEHERIHDHRFSFWSGILVGELISQNYERSTVEGMPIGEYQYVPEKQGAATVSNRYRFVGETRLAERPRSVHAAGSSYHLSYDSIHGVALPRSSMTCTLVLRGPRERDHSSFFASSGHYESTGNVMFTAEELAARCSSLASAIRSTRL
jgi:hypothetical protein